MVVVAPGQFNFVEQVLGYGRGELAIKFQIATKSLVGTGVLGGQ